MQMACKKRRSPEISDPAIRLSAAMEKRTGFRNLDPYYFGTTGFPRFCKSSIIQIKREAYRYYAGKSIITYRYSIKSLLFQQAKNYLFKRTGQRYPVSTIKTGQTCN